MENIVKIPGLYDAGYRAHLGTSFSPEKRAESIVSGYEAELNEDLKNIPESEQQRYIENYTKNLFHWLSAKSRCLSSMITGPANFPTRRNEKANNTEHNASVTFTEWREKALRAISRKIENDKSEEQKQSEHWAEIEKNLLSKIRTIESIKKDPRGSSLTLFKANLYGRVETLSKNIDIVLFKKALDIIKEHNIFTNKHKIWLLLEKVEQSKAKKVHESEETPKETTIKGIRVVENKQEDRIQLFFDGKPEPETISKLKHNAFKWSPSRGCWQRQLTNSAIYATNQLLKQI